MAAYFLIFVIAAVGLTAQVNAMVTGLGPSPTQPLVAVVVFYVLLRFFMETLSMMVATAPVITPVIISLGFHPVWFGVLIMLLIETAMITPPVGIDLFVVQGVRKRGPLLDRHVRGGAVRPDLDGDGGIADALSADRLMDSPISNEVKGAVFPHGGT